MDPQQHDSSPEPRAERPDHAARRRALQEKFLAGTELELEVLDRGLTCETGPSQAFLTALMVFAHRLKGSAGCHGFHDLGNKAGVLEQRVRTQAPHRDQLATFRLLRRALNSATCPAPVSSATLNAEAARGSVLVVEDDLNIALLIESILEERGYSVETIADGDAALQRLRAGPQPDVLVLDLMLPTTSGMEMIPLIKQDPDLQDLPVIVLSALVSESVQHEALNCGAYAFLKKPFLASDLTSLVHRSRATA